MYYTSFMYQKKKEKLYINEIVSDPIIHYPSYYVLSASMHHNEYLHTALISLHTCDFQHYEIPNSFNKIFENLSNGCFPIYKEQYVIGYFGGKMMYLESNGWRAMPVNADIFKLEHWLIG